MEIRLRCFFLITGIMLLGINLFAQAPIISYAPSIDVYTLNTAITGPTLTNAGGAVAAFAFGTGVPLAGATLSNPYGMGIDPTTGNIYVCNYGNGTVSKYNSLGTFISNTFFTGGTISNPAGITFDASGNAYLLNYNRTNNGLGNGNAYVDQYNSSGAYQSTIVQGLGTANGIAIDLSSNLYVAQGSNNGGNNTVSQFNTSGALGFTTGSTNTANPVAVAVDGSGNIYVLDNTNQNVTKFNSTGTYVSTLITGFTNPNAICTDGAGDIYVGDSGTGGGTGSVKVYDSSGTLLTTIAGLTDPEGLVTDSKGNLYVSDYTNGTITKYPPIGGYHLSGALYAGLSFNSTTGVFSGAPTTPFTATNYTVTAYNASGNSTSNTITLSCPANLAAPDISYNPSINVFTIGTAITPLSATNVGGAPTSWTIVPSAATLLANTGLTFTSTGVNAGTFSGTPTKSSGPTDYSVTATNASGSSTARTSIACVIDDFWTGSNSSSWTDALNWSAGVPTKADLASVGVINYTGPDPVVTANTNAYFVTFGAANSATLTVNSGVTFTINNILIINNNAAPIFQGSGSISLATSCFVNITGTGALTISSPLTVTLQSNPNGSAQIGQMTTGSITGTVSVQRYITGGAGYRGYRLLSSPVSTSATSGVVSINYIKNSCYVTGTTGAAGGFDVGFVNNPTLYLFRENLAGTNGSFTSGNFRGVNDLTTAPAYGIDVDGPGYSIYDGNGYLFFFRGDRSKATLANEGTSYVPTNTTLTATGALNQGQITVKNWYTGSANLLETNISPSLSVKGFNLVGNPYASSIDWDTYSTTLPNTTGIYAPGVASFLYILMPNGNYNIYQANPNGNHQSTGGIANSNVIPSGQGFFVQATGANPSLTFNESAKIKSEAFPGVGGNLFLGPPPQAAVSQYLHLLLTQDSVKEDGTLISFKSNAVAQYVPGEDAPYKAGSGPASLNSISADNVALAINTMPLPKQVPVIIPLNVNANKDGTYQLNMSTIKEIPAIYEVWLMDAYTKDSLDFRQTPTYSFDIVRSIAASHGAGRFSIVIRQNPALGIHLLSFTATKASDGAETVWKTENEQNYTNFTIERSNDGGATFNVVGGYASSGLSTYSLLDKDPIKGANQYRLKIEDLNGAITYSNVVTLMYGDSANNVAANNISVYPNPVVGPINLTIAPNIVSASGAVKLSNPPYSITITNSSGSVVKTVTSLQTQWQDNVSDMLPGTYVIQVVNANNKTVVGKTKFIKL